MKVIFHSLILFLSMLVAVGASAQSKNYTKGLPACSKEMARLEKLVRSNPDYESHEFLYHSPQNEFQDYKITIVTDFGSDEHGNKVIDRQTVGCDPVEFAILSRFRKAEQERKKNGE